jgi:DNA-damage-inducible protein J
MATTAFVRARVDENVKNEAAVILAGMGLTVSDACRMVLTLIASEKKLPFETKIPSAKTRMALTEAANIEKTFSSVDDMLVDIES